MSVSNRDIAIDLSKGIAIILMVIGHSLPDHHPFRDWIYSFHMPLFFMMSGMTFTPKPWKVLLKSNTQRLIIPYLFLSCINIFINGVVGNWRGVHARLLGIIYPDSYIQLVPHIGFAFNGGVGWFLFALFWCKLFMNWIYQGTKNWYLPICFLLTIISGYIGKYLFNLPFGILIGACGLGYMAVGRYISEHKNLFLRVSIWFWICFIPIWIYVSQRWYFEMWGFTYLRRMYVVTMIIANLASLCLYRLCVYVGSFSTNKKRILVPFLQWCGINSLTILLCHQIAGEINNALIYRLNLDASHLPIGLWLILNTFIITSVWVFYSKYVSGKRDMEPLKTIFRTIQKKIILSQRYIYASENNGWKKEGSNPVWGDEHTSSVFDPYVYVDSSQFVMLVSERKHHGIERLVSTDGIHWNESQTLLSRIPNTWQDLVNRAMVLRCSGIWHLWYTGQSPSISCIGHAISYDGINFENAVAPCLTAELPCEGMSVMNPCVLWNEEKHIFQMWYAAGENYEPNVICYAESRDGEYWEKREEPVMTKCIKHRWERDRVGGCNVVREKDGTYTMYYIGYQNIHLARICYAQSIDGIHWTRPRKNLLLAPTKNAWDADACYKPSVCKVGKKLYLWYNGRKEDKEYIGLAIKDV